VVVSSAPTLHRELSAALPGPAWLRRRREAAAGRLDGLGLPTTDEEVWRYSRIGELDLDRFTLAAGADGVSDALRAVLRGLPTHAGGVVVADGAVVHRHLDPDVAARGVTIGNASEIDEAEGWLAGADEAEPVDVFATLTDAFVRDPVVIDVPAGVVIEDPLVVVHWVGADGVAVFERTIVRVGEGAQVTLLEMEASSEVTSFTVPLLDATVADGARLSYLSVQELGLAVWRIANRAFSVGSDASLVAAEASLGGDYSRTRTDCRLLGRNAHGELLAAYLGAGDQMLDFRTFQHHEAPDTTSDLLFKGAVGGHSRSVYTGLIRVHPEARGTKAFQTNRNIKLSEGAWAESVPNLEIETNDVRCSHASAVGPVDADQRFYLESRGVPPAIADRLIVAGFFEEVLARFPVPAIAADVRSALVTRIEEVGA
jgi:Fe-S cluster assembly protein SufD